MAQAIRIRATIRLAITATRRRSEGTYGTRSKGIAGSSLSRGSTIAAAVPKRALLAVARCCRPAAMLEADAGVTRSTRRRVVSAGLPTAAATGVAAAGTSLSTASANVRTAPLASGVPTGPATGRAGPTPTGRRAAVRCFCFRVFLAMFQPRSVPGATERGREAKASARERRTPWYVERIPGAADPLACASTGLPPRPKRAPLVLSKRDDHPGASGGADGADRPLFGPLHHPGGGALGGGRLLPARSPQPLEAVRERDRPDRGPAHQPLLHSRHAPGGPRAASRLLADLAGPGRHRRRSPGRRHRPLHPLPHLRLRSLPQPCREPRRAVRGLPSLPAPAGVRGDPRVDRPPRAPEARLLADRRRGPGRCRPHRLLPEPDRAPGAAPGCPLRGRCRGPLGGGHRARPLRPLGDLLHQHLGDALRPGTPRAARPDAHRSGRGRLQPVLDRPAPELPRHRPDPRSPRHGPLLPRPLQHPRLDLELRRAGLPGRPLPDLLAAHAGRIGAAAAAARDGGGADARRRRDLSQLPQAPRPGKDGAVIRAPPRIRADRGSGLVRLAGGQWLGAEGGSPPPPQSPHAPG